MQPDYLGEPARNGGLPAWSEHQGILSLEGLVIKRFGQPAENQRAILRAFERQGWPAWVANPIRPDNDKDDRQRLADAVRRLNDNQENPLIRFRRDGRGKGVIWEFVKAEK